MAVSLEFAILSNTSTLALPKTLKRKGRDQGKRRGLQAAHSKLLPLIHELEDSLFTRICTAHVGQC